MIVFSSILFYLSIAEILIEELSRNVLLRIHSICEMVKIKRKNRQCKPFLCQLFIFGYYNIKEKTWKKPGQKYHDDNRDKIFENQLFWLFKL